jgi:1-acyl-sn-glycerol-3-phosphate acyltransferase
MTRSDLTTKTPDTTSIQSSQSRVSPWLPKILHPLGQFIVLPTFFRKIEVFGQEHVPRTGAVILAPTHRTRWDPMLVPYAVGPYVTGRSSRFMVSADEMKGIQGWFVRRMGGFPVDTTKPGIASIRHSVELLHDGQMLTIFPEGNIFRDGTLHPLKKGLARIATHAVSLQPDLALKVIPIALNYEHPIARFRDRVSIHIGTPLDVQSYQQFSPKQASEQLHQDLTRSLEYLMTR